MKRSGHTLTIDSSRRKATDTALAFVKRIAQLRDVFLSSREPRDDAGGGAPVYTHASNVKGLLRTLFS